MTTQGFLATLVTAAVTAAVTLFFTYVYENFRSQNLSYEYSSFSMPAIQSLEIATGPDTPRRAVDYTHKTFLRISISNDGGSRASSVDIYAPSASHMLRCDTPYCSESRFLEKRNGSFEFGAIDGEETSTALATITSEIHPYNADENLRVSASGVRISGRPALPDLFDAFGIGELAYRNSLITSLIAFLITIPGFLYILVRAGIVKIQG